MAGFLAKVLVAAGVLTFASVCQAQAPGNIDDVKSIHSELIGAPVYAADGTQIGEVADISFDEEDQPQKMRMTSGAVLGLGTRTVELPARMFIVLRGAIVVDLPAEAVQVLPELTEQETDSR
jgi:sporulation protein YlmC with PRC-barrel domain